MTTAALAELVKNWAGTSTNGLKRDGSLDKRKFNKEVLREAWVMGIVDENGNLTRGHDFPSVWDTAVLWELLKDDISANAGISLASNKVWRHLGMWEHGYKWHQESMFKEMENILIALDLDGFIYFNCAGSVWSISIK